MTLLERRDFLKGDDAILDPKFAGEKVRDRVSVIEVWCEVLGGDPKNLNGIVSREINALLERIPGWKRSDKVLACGKLYGKQRVFLRCESGNKDQENGQQSPEIGQQNPEKRQQSQ